MPELGHVKFFNAGKGWGFIQSDAGGPDIFLHIRELRRSGIDKIVEGQKIKFELEDSQNGKGPKAIKLEVVK